MLKRLLIVAALLIPALLCAQAPQTPGERMVKQGLEVSAELKALIAQLDRIDCQDKKPAHGRGRKVDLEAVKERRQRAFARHNYRAMVKPEAIPASFDCRTDGGFKVLPVNDQGQCGDCFGVSAFDGCSMALVYAGVLPLDGSKGRLSSQYGLDNQNAFQGGCNGGDEGQVIDFVMNTGAPLTSDYGPYTASPGQLKPTAGMKFYKIKDYGFADIAVGAGGVANTALMQAAIAKYGPISVAFDAGGCDSYQWPQVMTARGNNVDHAVLCIGWKTENGKVIFLGMNQWGNWGGPGGTFWIQESSYSWGVEAMWISGGTAPVPPPPDPPSGNTTITIDLTPAQKAIVQQQVGGATPLPANTIVVTPELANAMQIIADAFSKAAKNSPKK